MDKSAFRSTVKGKLNNHSGFSYLEMLMVVFILSLCTGVITDTLALGVKHLQKLTKQTQAVILYDTLSAVVQNDLTYVKGYKEGCFISDAKDIRGLWTQYGTGTWDANNMLEKDNANLLAAVTPDNPDTYWRAYNVKSSNNDDDDDDDDDKIVWKNWNDPTAKAGQIIRRSAIPDNGSVSFFYSPLTSSQDYSGKGLGGITSNDPLYATISVEPDDEMKYFNVTITVYDSKTPSDEARLVGGKPFQVPTIGTVKTDWS